MKRFLIPAFFVIHSETQQAAEDRAGKLQGELLTRLRDNESKDTLFLDEELPTREIPINDEETELPHTYKVFSMEPLTATEMRELIDAEEQQRRDEKHGLYCEHEDIAN